MEPVTGESWSVVELARDVDAGRAMPPPSCIGESVVSVVGECVTLEGGIGCVDVDGGDEDEGYIPSGGQDEAM